jgi:hypothetical protein
LNKEKTGIHFNPPLSVPPHKSFSYLGKENCPLIPRSMNGENYNFSEDFL